jgi:hypothetical protein
MARVTIARMRARATAPALRRGAMSVAIAACIGACSTIVDPDPGPPPLACSSGDTNPCRCADGSYGVQLCNGNVGSFGICRDSDGELCERSSSAGRGGGR